MTTLFFDTETTGKFDYKQPATAEGQPRLVTFSGLLTDERYTTLATMDFTVRPEGFTISEQVSAIHGVTHQEALDTGIPVKTALHLIDCLMDCADLIVAFNLKFDAAILENECHHAGVPFVLTGRTGKCAMQRAKSYCKIPGQYGDWKYPKLQEAYTHFFGQPFDGAHESASDAAATRGVWRAMMELEHEQSTAKLPKAAEVVA